MTEYFEERWEIDGILIAVVIHGGCVNEGLTEDIESINVDGYYFLPHPFGGDPIPCKEDQTMKHYYTNKEGDES